MTAGRDADEIDTGCGTLSASVFFVPGEEVFPCGQVWRNDASHPLTFQIIDGNLGRPALGEQQSDADGFPEGVGIERSYSRLVIFKAVRLVSKSSVSRYSMLIVSPALAIGR